jgi:hypothetical protein
MPPLAPTACAAPPAESLEERHLPFHWPHACPPQDSPLTNAGNGSNLNIAGVVECDASVMAGDGAFGAVGAAPGLCHPGAAAARIAEEARRPLPLGLVRPM